MIYEVKVDAKQVQTYLEKIRKNERAKKNLLEEIGIRGENLMIDEAEKIRAFGTLARSVHHVRGVDEVAITTGVNYAEIALETGRSPGKMPNVEAIRRWARKKGIPGKPYLIARKIARQGTRKYRTKTPKQITRVKQRLEGELPGFINKYVKLYD